MNKQDKSFPLVYELSEEYTALRQQGLSRQTAINRITKDYSAELTDEDDSAFVKVGLAVALCQRKELTTNVQTAALEALSQPVMVSESAIGELIRLKEMIENSEHLGDEALYRITKPYIPRWEIGDTFAHQIHNELSVEYGIHGWYIIFRKTGQYINHCNKYQQYGYISLCPPSSLPKTTKELESLGYLRMMARGDQKWNYYAQLSVISKRAENAYGFVKIGHFTDVKPPEDQAEENPLVSVPLSEQRRKSGDSHQWPVYEDTVCKLYQRSKSPTHW